MDTQARPRLGVSHCLLGAAVRYDGGHRRCDWLADVLAPHVDLVPVCPEVEAGLSTPREPMHLDADRRLRGNDSGRDFTPALADFLARRTPELAAAGLDGFVLKSRSPSCGLAPSGLFAAALVEALPALPVTEETTLAEDGEAREHFAVRLFAQARLRALLAGPWTPKDFTGFHAREKMLLLAHDRHLYDRLGRLAAEAHARPREETARDYADAFAAALAKPAGVSKHVNALQHMAGHFKGRLDALGREELRTAIDAYRTGAAARAQAVALLRALAAEVNLRWVLEQTYLAPCPEALLAS